MTLLFSPAFLQCLIPARSEATNVSTIPVGPPVENNLELLMETHLAVTLRFGQRQMLLREIMQLNSGSVVELDRKATDPVDLLLDDRIVARGQVVVVDGNYGLRITEICAT